MTQMTTSATADDLKASAEDGEVAVALDARRRPSRGRPSLITGRGEPSEYLGALDAVSERVDVAPAEGHT